VSNEIEVFEWSGHFWMDHEGNERPKFRAQIKDRPNCWSCGKCPEEAVGDLITHHPEKFGMKVIYLERREK